MERSNINSLFSSAKSLPLEVSLSQVETFVAIQARTPAGQSNSWFNSQNFIIMTGIITVGIAAILAWPQTDQHAAQQVVTDQNTLQVAQSLVSEPVSPNGEPSSYEEVAFAMETEREQEMEPVSPPLEFRIEKKPMAETSEPLQTPDEFTLNGRSIFEESSPIVEEEKKYEEAQEVLSQVETPKAV